MTTHNSADDGAAPPFHPAEPQRSSPTAEPQGSSGPAAPQGSPAPAEPQATGESRLDALRAEAEQLRRELEQTELARQQAQQSVQQALTAARVAQNAARQAQASAAQRQATANRLVADALEQAEQSRAALQQLCNSPFWRITRPLRAGIGLLPPPVRRVGRGGAKLLRWSLTLQLRRRLRERQELLRTAAPPPPPVLAPVVAPAAAPLLLPGDSGVQPGTAPAAQPEACQDVATMVWPDLFRLRARAPGGRIAVVLHLFYPELWDEFEAAFAALTEPYDLFVTLVQGHSDAMQPKILARFPDAAVLVFPNHGRDVYPFIALINSGVLFRYELICKLHSKRSPHRQDGDAWRRSLTAGLLRDAEHVRSILSSFRADPDLGIVVARGNVVGQEPHHWGSNLHHVHRLSARIGIPPLREGHTFPGGSVYWIRPFLLRPLSGTRLTPEEFEPEPLPYDGTAAHAVERLIGLICHDAGMRIAEEHEFQAPGTAGASPPVDVIAFYRPQFYPTPQTGRWHGEGFTDWTEAARAQPQFPGHRQPRLPADLGFYDLRLPEARAAQAALARRYGVAAFCYHHYWFDGTPLLQDPVQAMLAAGEPDFPFLLCWANAPWTRDWNGLPGEVLMPQSYRPGWTAALARDLAPLLRDRRYWRVGGRPMLLIERVMQIPGPAEAIAGLRAALRAEGVGEVHLAAGWVAFAGDPALPEDPQALGLDAYVEMPPQRLSGAREVTEDRLLPDSEFEGRIDDYGSVVDGALQGLQAPLSGRRYRGATMGWDDTARRGRSARILHGATPASFRRWLRGLVLEAAARPGPAGDRMVFVNAWNDWAEGSALEPDQDFGLGWLEAVASSLPPATQGGVLEAGGLLKDRASEDEAPNA